MVSPFCVFLFLLPFSDNIGAISYFPLQIFAISYYPSLTHGAYLSLTMTNKGLGKVYGREEIYSIYFCRLNEEMRGLESLAMQLYPFVSC